MKLHPKYALNPTVPICYFCGKPKNELILLGASCKDEAPMNMCVNKEPCDECKELAKKGIVLISVRDGESGDNPYRTGKILVIRQEAFERIFNRRTTSRFCFVEDSVLDRLTRR